MATNDVQGAYDDWSMVVLYDPKTGDIAHTHQAVTTRGGAHPDEATLEQLAADHAARARNIPVGGLAFLHVDPRGVDLGARYKVDVNSRSLVKAATGEAKA